MEKWVDCKNNNRLFFYITYVLCNYSLGSKLLTNENTNKPYPVKVRKRKNNLIYSRKCTKKQPF